MDMDTIYTWILKSNFGLPTIGRSRKVGEQKAIAFGARLLKLNWRP